MLTIKALRGADVSSVILNFCTKWSLLTRFRLRPIYTRKRTTEPIQNETAWGPNLVWTLWRTEKFLASTGKLTGLKYVLMKFVYNFDFRLMPCITVETWWRSLSFIQLTKLSLGLTPVLKLQMNDLLHASLQIFGSVTSPCNSDTRDRLAKNNLKFTARCASHHLGVTASVQRIN